MPIVTKMQGIRDDDDDDDVNDNVNAGIIEDDSEKAEDISECVFIQELKRAYP